MTYAQTITNMLNTRRNNNQRTTRKKVQTRNTEKINATTDEVNNPKIDFDLEINGLNNMTKELNDICNENITFLENLKTDNCFEQKLPIILETPKPKKIKAKKIQPQKLTK